MIRINLAQNEISRLLEFARRDLQADGMGSDDFIIPEYRILMEKIAHSTHFIELTNTETEILCGWISDGIAGSRIRKIEDGILAGKVYDAIHDEYRNIKDDYQFRITRMRDSLNAIAKMAGKEELSPPVDTAPANPVSEPGENSPSEEIVIPENPFMDRKNTEKESERRASRLSEKDQAKNVRELAEKMKKLAKKMK